MTILYPVPELLPDSRARFIQIMNTCNALALKGCEVKILTGKRLNSTQDAILAFYDLPREAAFEIVSLPMLRREHARFFRWSWHGIFDYSVFLYLLSLRSDAGKKTVLFVRHLKLADFLLRRRKAHSLPIVFEAHEIFSKDKDAKNHKKIVAVEKNVYGLSDALVFISKELRDAVGSIFPGTESKPYVIAHDAVRNEWLANPPGPERKYICYAGSLYKWKGIDILISAMEYLPHEMLLIIGGGSRLNELRNDIAGRGLKNIQFAGNIPHYLIPEFFSQAKVAVLPNIESGPSSFSSPLKLFEYMACGVPIVASDIPVFREILEHTKNALFVKPGEPEALALAIRSLLDNPSLACNIAEQAKKDSLAFTYEKRAEKILSLCGRVIFERGSAALKGADCSQCT